MVGILALVHDDQCYQELRYALKEYQSQEHSQQFGIPATPKISANTDMLRMKNPPGEVEGLPNRGGIIFYIT